MLITGMT